MVSTEQGLIDLGRQINEIKSLINKEAGYPCKHEQTIGTFKQVINVEIPEMKRSIKELDSKVGEINDAVVIIKNKFLNGSFKGISIIQFWSGIGTIILVFGTIILMILGKT